AGSHLESKRSIFYPKSLSEFSNVQVDTETKGDLSSRSLLSEFKSGHDLQWCCLGQTRLAKEVEVTFDAHLGHVWAWLGNQAPNVT
ncbi:hypothetical protein PIB30_070199, partial [Stylosanthes scabra]|nr:hypothetical protein [Stylosanthes scabra]